MGFQCLPGQIANTAQLRDHRSQRLDQRATCGIDAAESQTPDATAEFIGILEPPGEESTVRLRFTAKPGTTGLLYAMVNFKSPTGDMELAVLARVVE